MNALSVSGVTLNVMADDVYYEPKPPRNAVTSPPPGPAGSGTERPADGRLVVATDLPQTEWARLPRSRLGS